MIGYKKANVCGQDICYKFSFNALLIFEELSKTEENPLGLKSNEFFNRVLADNVEQKDVITMIYSSMLAWVERKQDEGDADIKLEFTQKQLKYYFDDDATQYTPFFLDIINLALPEDAKIVEDQTVQDISEEDKKK